MIEKVGFGIRDANTAGTLGCSGCECECTKPGCCTCSDTGSYTTDIGTTVDVFATAQTDVD